MKKSLWLLLGLSTVASAVSAETPEQQGLVIAVEAERRDDGFGDNTAALEMVLYNEQGEHSTRRIRAKTLEDTDGEKRIMIFDEPLDVKDTVMLTFTHKQRSDDQWMYLPAIKRVKRIASNNKAGPFMGGEFAYEDLGSQEVEKYTYRYVADEKCAGGDCFVIERYPVEADSGYSRQVLWLDKTEYRAWKLEYYDRKNSLLKVLVFDRYEQHLGKYWRAHEMTMTNMQTGKKTVLKWNGFRFRVGLDDAAFNPSRLRDVR